MAGWMVGWLGMVAVGGRVRLVVVDVSIEPNEQQTNQTVYNRIYLYIVHNRK